VRVRVLLPQELALASLPPWRVCLNTGLTFLRDLDKDAPVGMGSRISSTEKILLTTDGR